jgi:hypothetical protein
MTLFLYAVNGHRPPAAMIYPVLVCDACANPIHGDGLAAWPDPAKDERPSRRWTPLFLHKGVCDQQVERNLGDLHTVEIGWALDQLARNFEHRFDQHERAERERAVSVGQR